MQRVKLIDPLPGNIDGQRVVIVDISRHGLRVAHQEGLGPQGERRSIEFEWDGHHVAVEGTLTHTRVERVGVASYARSIYHSGFTIATISTRSEQVLREMAPGDDDSNGPRGHAAQQLEMPLDKCETRTILRVGRDVQENRAAVRIDADGEFLSDDATCG